MEPAGPPPAHVPVPPRRVVTDECYPFTSRQSQPAAPPCMMHSRSTGRGKRQATARCPNPQTHSNEIYQSTPAYRLSSSVSAGPGGGAGALWIGERGAGRGLARAALPGKSEFGNAAGKTPLRSPPGSGSSSRHLHNSRPWVLEKLCLHPWGWGGHCRGSQPRCQPGATRCHPALCLQEKEIMKELLENGPVQGTELAGAPLCAPQKVGGTRWGGKAALPGLGELPCEAEPPSAAPPAPRSAACPGSAAPVPVTLPTPGGTGWLINSEI